MTFVETTVNLFVYQFKKLPLWNIGQYITGTYIETVGVIFVYIQV